MWATHVGLVTEPKRLQYTAAARTTLQHVPQSRTRQTTSGVSGRLKQPFLDGICLIKCRQQLLRQLSVSRPSNSGDSDQPEAQRRHDSLRKALCDESCVYVLAGNSRGIPLGYCKARAVGSIGGASVCQFIAQASSRLLGAETTTLNQNPRSTMCYTPFPTPYHHAATCALSQLNTDRTQPGIPLPPATATPDLMNTLANEFTYCALYSCHLLTHLPMDTALPHATPANLKTCLRHLPGQERIPSPQARSTASSSTITREPSDGHCAPMSRHIASPPDSVAVTWS